MVADTYRRARFLYRDVASYVRRRIPVGDTACAFGRYTIRLPYDHSLTIYQKRYKLYDRFLPHLAGHLEPGSLVVDVGANCGDTLAAMNDRTPGLEYVCIEPDDRFFDYLTQNVARIRQADPALRVRTLKALIGSAVASASLHGSLGTKRATVGDAPGALPSMTLDNALRPEERGRVRLLKSDVDGFDYDVLDSARICIRDSRPILFFECQFDVEDQVVRYTATIERLHGEGYRHWLVFDNFGEVLLEATTPAMLAQLFRYVERQNRGRSTRTLHYYDVMGCTDADAGFVQDVVQSYIASDIRVSA